MGRIGVFLAGTVAALLMAAAISAPAHGQALDGAAGPIWSDEFEGASGSVPDPTKWTHDTGFGWGSGAELQAYTERTRNASLDGQGNLAITARAETYTGPDGKTSRYTSARLNTREKFSLAYGRIEARIRVPSGQGIWPAFWLLGDDIFTTGWPGCGEIDMMEVLGDEPNVLYQSIHGPQSEAGDGEYGLTERIEFARPLSAGFHVYGAEWGPERISLTADGEVYRSFTPADLPPSARWVFDHPHHLILNVAVGGDWPGPPDASTPFPATMLVDWVRVWDRGPRPETARFSGGGRLIVRGRTVRPRLACDGGAGCRGKTVLRAPVESGNGQVVLGRRPYSIGAGASKRTAIRLTRPGRELLAERPNARAKIVVTGSGGESDSRSVTLRSRSRA
jgi:beta-glucanase (GH16 family)